MEDTSRPSSVSHRDAASLYIRAIVAHWVFLVWAFIGVAGRVSTATGHLDTLPSWVWYLVMIGGFFLANVRAFRDVVVQKALVQSQLDDALLRLRDRERKQQARDRLGVLFTEGRELLNRAAAEDSTLTEDEINEWATRVRAEVATSLGQTDAALLGSAAGLTMPFATSVQDLTFRKWHSVLLLWVNRLEQFIARLDAF